MSTPRLICRSDNLLASGIFKPLNQAQSELHWFITNAWHSATLPCAGCAMSQKLPYFPASSCGRDKRSLWRNNNRARVVQADGDGISLVVCSPYGGYRPDNAPSYASPPAIVTLQKETVQPWQDASFHDHHRTHFARLHPGGAVFWAKSWPAIHGRLLGHRYPKEC